MLRVEAPADAIDIVGTGGDESGSYNISTLAAMIVAGLRRAGRQARQPRRLVELRRGRRADRARRQDRPRAAGGWQRCIARSRLGFMFAPTHHASMRHVGAGARRTRHAHDLQPARAALQSGRREAPAPRRVLRRLAASRWPRCCSELGSERVWMVHGSDGLDEITTTGPTACRRRWRTARSATSRSTPEEVGPRTRAARRSEGRRSGAQRRGAARRARRRADALSRHRACSTPPPRWWSPARRAICAKASRAAAQALDSGAGARRRSTASSPSRTREDRDEPTSSPGSKPTSAGDRGREGARAAAPSSSGGDRRALAAARLRRGHRGAARRRAVRR